MLVKHETRQEEFAVMGLPGHVGDAVIKHPGELSPSVFLLSLKLFPHTQSCVPAGIEDALAAGSQASTFYTSS